MGRLPACMAGLRCLHVLFCLLCGHWAWADVVIVRPDNQTEKVFIDYELTFTATIPTGGIQGYVQVANPSSACTPIEEPPFPTNSSYLWFVLIERNPCSFEIKVRNAQKAGYQAAIVYNVGPPSNSNNGASFSVLDDEIKIPGILIGQDDGRKLRSDYTYAKGYTVIINPDSSFNLNTYLLPFAIVIGFCFVIMLLFMVVKCIKDRRRSRRNRLSSRHLKHLTTIKFKKGDKYEVCAVCLDEYCEGEKLRILPCAHAYHTKCIDPWLTNNRRNCPICKRKVAIPGVTPESDSDSETDQEASETTPLLQSSNGSSNFPEIPANRTNGGTFSSPSTSRGSSTHSSLDERSANYRPLRDQEAGPSSQSGSYQDATLAQMHSRPSKVVHPPAEDSSDEDIYNSLIQHAPSTALLLAPPDERHSINGDEDETPSVVVVVAAENGKATKKSKTELVV